MARPKDAFDWKLFDALIKNESSEQFCAEIMLTTIGIDPDFKKIQAQIKLIQRRVKEKWDCSFVQYREQKKEHRRGQLRQWQWKCAEKGNPTMLIWLGKQYLGQSDKIESLETYDLQLDLTKHEDNKG